MELLSIYHRSPYPLRVAMATLQGARLDRWRYGRDLDDLVARAREREYSSPVARKIATENQLAEMLHHAATTVPYYREYWERRQRSGDRASYEELERWPTLSKSEVRSIGTRLLSDAPETRRRFEDHTSGTTGSPMSVFLDRPAVREWYALFECRIRRWNGLCRGDRWAILGGQLVVPPPQSREPFWVWNAAGHQLYLSSFHISAATADAYAHALRSHRVKWLLGYPSSIAALVTAWETAGTDVPPLEAVVTNAEPLLDNQRRVIERVLSVVPRETYGMAEAVSGASQCEHGTLHLWPEAGIVEVLDPDGQPVVQGTTGRLVSTGLLNRAMPLVRYEIGDSVSVHDSQCACGRTLPAFGEIAGRSDDMVVTRDGRRVGRLDGVFKADLPIVEAQIVQRTLDEIELLVVPADGFDARTGAFLVENIRNRVGDVQVRVTEVSTIPRTSNGKFRAVVCDLRDARDVRDAASRPNGGHDRPTIEAR